MSEVPLKKVSFDDLQKRVFEGSISEAEVEKYFLQVPPKEETLEPKMWLNPDLVELPVEEAVLESALLMNTANAWCYQMRKHAYKRKLSKPGGDKLIRVMAEGDSWFQYPFKLLDVIDHISARPDVAVRCFSAAGDVLGNMVARPQFIDAIHTEKPRFFLVSGGGNDLVNGRGLRDTLKPYNPALSPKEYLNEAYKSFRARIFRLYGDLFKLVHREDAKLHVICHGYSYAIPNKDRGPWLGKPMEDIGISDRVLQSKIMKVIVNDINATIAAAAQGHQGGPVTYVDLREVVTANGWYDEFHPNDEYFGKAAAKIGSVIK